MIIHRARPLTGEFGPFEAAPVQGFYVRGGRGEQPLWLGEAIFTAPCFIWSLGFVQRLCFLGFNFEPILSNSSVFKQSLTFKHDDFFVIIV
jgi:hypothetical protein